MSGIKWLYQNNLGKTSDEEVIKESCNKYGYEFEGIKVIPFSDEVPNIEENKTTIYYGSTGWINKIYEKYNPSGIFFNPESIFTFWVNKYGESCLNYGATETTLKDFSNDDYNDDELFFIRPVSDLKEFNGGVMSFKDIRSWESKINCHNLDLGSIPIVIGEAFGISHKWRLFLVDGKVSSGSQYRTYYVLNIDENVPKNVISFAEAQAKVYSPADVFVMDIGKSNNNLYIIEIGCFNSAGFYGSDIEKIVFDVSNFMEELC